MKRHLNGDDFVAGKLAWHQQIVRDPKVPTTAKALAGLILHDLNPIEGGSWRSQESMAANLGVTPRQLRRVLKILEDAGYLDVEHRKGRTRTNICRATVPSDGSAEAEKRTSASPQPAQKRTSKSHQSLNERTSMTRKRDMHVHQSLYDPIKRVPPCGGRRTPEGVRSFAHADTRELVVRVAGEDAAYSYLDQAGWDEGGKRIVCTSAIGFERLRALAGRPLAATAPTRCAPGRTSGRAARRIILPRPCSVRTRRPGSATG